MHIRITTDLGNMTIAGHPSAISRYLLLRNEPPSIGLTLPPRAYPHDNADTPESITARGETE